MIQFKREVGAVLLDHDVVDIVSGDPASCPFDFFKIYEFVKSRDKKPVCIRLLHTYPDSFTIASKDDWDVITGWAKAMGITVEIWVITNKSVKLYRCMATPELKWAEFNVVPSYATYSLLEELLRYSYSTVNVHVGLDAIESFGYFTKFRELLNYKDVLDESQWNS